MYSGALVAQPQRPRSSTAALAHPGHPVQRHLHPEPEQRPHQRPAEPPEQAERQGKSPPQAALEAARLRLRPILMTSLAFIFGVLPLAISTGAGAQSRIAIGTAVIGGMLTATVLAIFFVPLFFVLVRKLFGGKRTAHAGGPDEAKADDAERPKDAKGEPA